MASPSDNGIPTGQLAPSTPNGEFNRLQFVILQALRKMQTATLVRVEAATNSGGVSPVGFVDVTPLVNQIDGEGLPTPHVRIYNIPYLRMQGGANAIILDPQPGDIGVCVFASRDISKVKGTRGQANPGSFRHHSFSDGLYLGGMLNGTPTQYVRFSPSGITLHSPSGIALEAPSIVINADTVAITSGTLTHNGVNIGADHRHSGVQSGSNTTGTPT